jgi:hypothetical protein
MVKLYRSPDELKIKLADKSVTFGIDNQSILWFPYPEKMKL